MTMIQTTGLAVPGGLLLATLLAWSGRPSTTPTVGVPSAAGPRAPAAASTSVTAEKPVLPEIAIHSLAEKVDLLRKGRAFLATVESYTAEFTKREVVNGVLLDEQVIALKCRHQPFSVHLHWLTGDEGREVLFVEGANQGKLLAHDGGWKSRLPAVSLSPDSPLARQDSRYPITMAGVKGLLELMLEMHEQDLERQRSASCEVRSGIDHGGRLCSVFLTHYSDPESSPVYRKSITWIDEEWGVPLKSLHFEWPQRPAVSEAELDESTLIESYEFSKLDFDAPLSDVDFDREHPDYRFR